MTFGEIIGNISGFMYGKYLIVVLLGAGLFLSIVFKFAQLRLFGESVRVTMEKPDKEGSISSFQALMVSTGSRVGTGNIIGVSTAVCCGGYGAVFWMWIIALLGGASAFAESTLAQIYKKKNPETGESYGGPAYYIEALTKGKVIAVVFAVSMLLTYAGGFNMLASFNLQSTFSAYGFYDKAVTPKIIGLILALIIFYCLMGGGKRIIKVSSVLVPFMGAIYVLVSLIVVFTHAGLIPVMFKNIFVSAFDFKAIFGGFAGSCIMFGMKRGLFSNEAGVGSAPNAAASADVSHPVKQGLVQMLSVYIDTWLLCTATAFMLLCSGVAPAEEIQGAPYVQQAVGTTLGSFGPIFITIAMCLFAFTTLIGNFYYVDNLLAYLMGHLPSKQFMTGFRIVAAVVIFIGATLEIGMAWDIADVLMGIMVTINIPVVLIMYKRVQKCLEDYLAQKRSGKNPVFKAASIGLDDAELDYWK